MRKHNCFLGMLALALAFGMVLTACGGKKSTGSAELDQAVELTKTAVDAAKALNSMSGGGGSSKKGSNTASKAEDFKYDLTADGKGVVIKGINLESVGTIKIPKEIEGYPVVEIESITPADFKPMSIAAITIPDTVTKLVQGEYGPGIFMETGISKISLPPKITEIPDNAFNGCAALTSITIPNGVTTIGMNAFLGCEALKEITIPDSVTTVGSLAFLDCSALTKVQLPSHPITYDQSSAFKGCSKLSLATRKAIQESGYTGEF